uniref:Uncharacterized protein n=1 Tax=Rhizophora mucronata TaxID=61149 RepID=A0A2P2L200_RHIMU
MHRLSTSASKFLSDRTCSTCPRLSISDFFSFFMAKISPVPLARHNLTSPNAPLPIMVSCSKSSIPTLRLCSLIYSVSLRSKFLSICSCSSFGILASCALL